MKTKLEYYLEENRQKLDIEAPDDDFLWSGIKKEIERKKSRFLISWKMAALLLLALVSGFVLNSILNPHPQVIQFSLANVSPELGQQELGFQVAIQQRMDEIDNYNIDSSRYTDFFSEMKTLEQFHQENIADFNEVGSNPRLIKAMLDYYELRIRVLELMLSEIEKEKLLKNEHYENETYY